MCVARLLFFRNLRSERAPKTGCSGFLWNSPSLQDLSCINGGFLSKVLGLGGGRVRDSSFSLRAVLQLFTSSSSCSGLSGSEWMCVDSTDEFI